MQQKRSCTVIITELEREETEASLHYHAEAKNAKTKNFEVQNYHLGMRKRTNFYTRNFFNQFNITLDGSILKQHTVFQLRSFELFL